MPTTDELARRAGDIFVTVGGPAWQDRLVLGGLAAVAFLVLFVAVLAALLAIESRR